MLDGLMNYPLRTALLGLIVDESLTPADFRLEVENQIAAYPQANLLAQYNLLGSHDTERVATLARYDPARLRQLFCLQFFLPGAPGIYYGDEVGLAGGKDPESRAAFPWNPAAWDSERRQLVQRLIALRNQRLELRRGSLHFLDLEDTSAVMALARRSAEEQSVLFANVSDVRRSMRVPAQALGWGVGREVRDALAGRAHVVGPEGLAVVMGARETVLLVD
jgi:glycosidase